VIAGNMRLHANKTTDARQCIKIDPDLI